MVRARNLFLVFCLMAIDNELLEQDLLINRTNSVGIVFNYSAITNMVSLRIFKMMSAKFRICISGNEPG
jgi:hypothetical protein